MAFWLMCLILIIICIYTLVTEGWGYFFGNLVVGIFFIGIITITVSIFLSVPEEADWKTHSKESIPIVSLRTQETIQGSFFIGSGTIGSYEKYFFMTSVGTNTFKRESLYTNDTIIKETNDESPNLSWTWEIFKIETKWWPNNFLIGPRYRQVNYILTVPKGTVIQKFNGIE